MASVQTRRSNRVFIDSSVLLAAAISVQGGGRELLRRGFRGEFDLYISSEVLEETERNLSLKAPQGLDAFYLLGELLLAKVVNPPRSLVLAAAKVVIAKDAPIVAAAVEAGANYLATYDRKHLLRSREKVKSRFGVTIALPGEVLANPEGN